MKRLRRFLSSMVGRLFVTLLLGMGVAAIGATLLAGAKRQQEFERQNLTRIADRLQGYVTLLDSNPELRERLLAAGGPSVRLLRPGARQARQDSALMDVLHARSGPVSGAIVHFTSFRSCMPRLDDLLPPRQPRSGHRRHAPAQHDPAFIPPRCRTVQLTLTDGTALRLALESPAVAHNGVLAVDPLFLSLLVLAIAVLAYGVARMASAPLQRLADAAQELGVDLHRAPMPVTGPLEVQRAAEAFNAMQEQLQRHLAERTHMLAAITHDLQTPVTRLRLRLENVQDHELRGRLVADLAAMQALIREGLELARSAESAEQRAPLDLDSLLESLVEDAAEAGHPAHFSGGCGAVLMLRPLAMRRLFSNLLDNALMYGHAASVRAEWNGRGLRVCISDQGPGLAEDDLHKVFDPFVRLETSRSRQTGGAGLGLTIARALAEKDGARVTLENRPGGGLDAVVQWALPVLAPPRGA